MHFWVFIVPCYQRRKYEVYTYSHILTYKSLFLILKISNITLFILLLPSILITYYYYYINHKKVSKKSFCDLSCIKGICEKGTVIVYATTATRKKLHWNAINEIGTASDLKCARSVSLFWRWVVKSSADTSW